MTTPSFIDDYEHGAARVRQAISGLELEDLMAFPVPGTWSIQQIVIHLADSEAVFADRIKRVIAEESSILLAFDEKAWTKNLHYNLQSAADAAVQIEVTRRQLSRVLKALPESAFERKGTHSEAGPLTLRQIVEKAVAHMEHHVKFIIDKREKLGKLMW